MLHNLKRRVFLIRFPFLLQDEATFAVTLKRNGWQLSTQPGLWLWPARSPYDSVNEVLHSVAAASSTSSKPLLMSTQTLRDRMWINPLLLYANVGPLSIGELPTDETRLFNAIR